MPKPICSMVPMTTPAGPLDLTALTGGVEGGQGVIAGFTGSDYGYYSNEIYLSNTPALFFKTQGGEQFLLNVIGAPSVGHSYGNPGPAVTLNAADYSNTGGTAGSGEIMTLACAIGDGWSIDDIIVDRKMKDVYALIYALSGAFTLTLTPTITGPGTTPSTTTIALSPGSAVQPFHLQFVGQFDTGTSVSLKCVCTSAGTVSPWLFWCPVPKVIFKPRSRRNHRRKNGFYGGANA